MHDRLIALEEKLAYLEKYLSELDGVVRALHQEVAGVVREMERLRAAAAPEEDEEGTVRIGGHEVPPHY
ncbi:MAG: SlyX [Pseudomonadota bacterium]|jgi:uncharacterized coiled-coil protein SlyX